MEATIPRLVDHLPTLFEFTRTLARQVEAGALRDGDDLILRLRDFYTPERTSEIERVAPGWTDMAAYADGATRNHVSQALIALQFLPEYRQASRHLQSMMEWTVLYHDLGKQVIGGQRDALHAFRSATLAARALPKLDFPAGDAHAAALEAWTRLVLGASVAAPDGKGSIQDYRALPEIRDGIERVFGAGSAAALIVQAVLLHHSLDVVPEWPNAGSLAAAELSAHIEPALLPLLEALMLVDSDAWQLFEPDVRARFRASTLAAFANVRRVLGE